MPISHKSGLYDGVEAALILVPSLCPIKSGCHGLACLHDATVSQASEAVGAFLQKADNSWY